MENDANQKIQEMSHAKFLKRLLAFIIDSLLLGLLGIILGFLFSETFIRMGWTGRFIGFIITLIYFAIYNSNLVNGQTLGQKIIKIKVVNKLGEGASLLQSTIRSSFLPLITLLNNWTLPVNSNSVLLQVISFILFSLILLEAYFFLFSGKSKQLLHDVITNTYVVEVYPVNSRAAFSSVSKQVLLFSFTPVILVVIILFLVKLLVAQPLMTDLLAIQSDLQYRIKPNKISIYKGNTVFKGIDNITNSTSFLRVSCIKHNQSDDNSIITENIMTVLNRYPMSKEVDIIELNYITGYDIGIASKWNNTSRKYTNQEFLDLVE